MPCTGRCLKQLHVTWHFYVKIRNMSFALKSVTFQHNTDFLINYKHDQGCHCIFKNIKRCNDQQCKCKQSV